MTYLFTKNGCGKCDWVKSKLDLDRVDDLKVMTLDGDDAEALAMLAYFECVNLSEKALPLLVSDNGTVIQGAIEIKNHLRDYSR